MTFCLMPKNAANMIAGKLTKMGSHVLQATRLVAVVATARAAQMVEISTSAAAELTLAIFSMACLVAAGRAPAGGGGPRPQHAPPPKGANIAYEHLVSFTDAATLAPQRILLGDGKTVEFKLPAGIVAGQQIRIPGRGQAGPGGNGDAMVMLKLGKHPDLVRDGDNIRIDLPISLKEAVAGGKVKVLTVDGAVMLTVPPRTNSGAVLRIKGRGFTAKTGARGDQLVTLIIHLPNDPAELERLSGVLSDSSVRENMGV